MDICPCPAPQILSPSLEKLCLGPQTVPPREDHFCPLPPSDVSFTHHGLYLFYALELD